MFDHIHSYPHGSIAYYLEGQTRRPQSSRDCVDKISVETDVRVGEQDSSSRLLVRANPSSFNTFIVDDKSRVNVSAHDKANIGIEEDGKCGGIYEFDDNCGAAKSPKVIEANLVEDVKSANNDYGFISMLACEDVVDAWGQDDNVRNMVDKAAELFNAIHEEICDANRMLLSLNKFSAVIPSKSVMLLRTSLLNDMSSLMKEILSRGTLLEKLRDEKDKMVLDIENLRGELQEARNTTASLKAEPKGNAAELLLKHKDFQRDCRDKNDACAHLVQLEESKAYVTGIVPAGNVEDEFDKAEPLFGKQTFVDVVLDGVKVKALIDSGATASIIMDKVVGKILWLKDKTGHNIVEVPREEYAEKRLFGADGSLLNVVNCVKIPLAWGDKPNKTAKFFVVRGLQQHAIIGTNVLQEDPWWIEAITSALGGKSKEAKNVAVLESCDFPSRESMNENKVESRGLETNVAEKEYESKVVNKIRKTQWPVMDTVIKTKNDYGKSSKKVFRKVENKSFKSDTVVIGGRNANKLARAIGASHWSTNALKDVDFLSKVCGGAVKRIIYLPSGDIFFHRDLEFAPAMNLYVSLFDQLSKLDAVEVFVLPVFRNCNSVNASVKLYSWYMKNAQVDVRFIGKQQVAGKNLFQWMDATNGVESRRNYVNAQGIITKDGVKRLCEYLNVLDNDLKVPDCAVRKNFVRACRSTQPMSINLVRDSSTQSTADRLYAARTWYNSNIEARGSYYQSACSTNPKKETVYGCHQPRARKKKRKFIPINGDVYNRKEGRVENIRH